MASIAGPRPDRRPIVPRKIVRNILYTLALVIMLFPVVAFFYWMLLIS